MRLPQLPGSRFSPCGTAGDTVLASPGQAQPWSHLVRDLSLGLPGCKGPFWIPLLPPPVQHSFSFLGRAAWPPAAQGLGLQTWMLRGHLHPACTGLSWDTRGRSRGRFGAHRLPSPWMAKAHELLPGSSPFPGPTRAALTWSLGAASWGAPHRRGQARTTPCSWVWVRPVVFVRWPAVPPLPPGAARRALTGAREGGKRGAR